MVMIRAMEKLPYFNYADNDDDVCSRCGKEGCTCDPDTCDCKPAPKQKDLIQDFEE
jgi:hypothetical protein